ncbi:MAG TPA: hypothetical protein VGB91_08250, partial [Rhizomicrobium sp.]
MTVRTIVRCINKFPRGGYNGGAQSEQGPNTRGKRMKRILMVVIAATSALAFGSNALAGDLSGY